MRVLDLSHNKFTTVGQIPGNISVMYIDLSFNKLRGCVSFPCFIVYLDYCNNEFSSIPPRSFPLGPNYINLANNKLSGPLPLPVDVKCNQNYSLDVLDLSGNYFFGLIPPYLLKGCNDMRVLKLRGNRLCGTWPDEMDPLCKLMHIDLHGNRLEGPLSRSLVNCQGLQVLDVGGNNFVDVF
jgi:Leucine-rich repeat (LRR) protein